MEVLSTYYFRIEHRAGKLHGNCDGLSRIPCNVYPGCKRLKFKEMQISSRGNCTFSTTQPYSPSDTDF